MTGAPSVHRRQILAEIRRLVVRMAEANQTWGYTRIQGALKNVGHCVGARRFGASRQPVFPPVPHRPTSWQPVLKAHGGVIAAADFFTTEVWTWRGLVTYYTVFVMDLESRRLQIVSSTPNPNEFFMHQISRTLTAPDAVCAVATSC